MVARRRLDQELVSRGMAASLEDAGRAIDARTVVVDDAPALRSGTLVARGARIGIRRARRFVSRGGDKLVGALEDLALDVSGQRCLDAGAGSGGFTDCLLQAGAAHVTAVDVGYGQFDWSVRTDERVTLHERTNLRSLPGALGALHPPFDLIVADLSFVSLRSMAPVLAELSAGRARLLLLVKPQFEAHADQVGQGGVIVDPQVWEEVLVSVIETLDGCGLGTERVVASRVKGAAGNQEFFLMAVPGAAANRQAAAEALGGLA